MISQVLRYCVWIILFIMVGCILTSSFGCDVFKLKPEQPQPVPDAAGQLYEAVKTTNWLVTVSIIGIAISIAALLNGSKLAMGTLVGCGTSLVMSLMVARYATVVAFAGLAGSGIVIILIALRNKNAFRELIKTVDITKDQLACKTDVNDLGRIFFNENSMVNSIQSESTKRLVDKVQKSLNGKEK